MGINWKHSNKNWTREVMKPNSEEKTRKMPHFYTKSFLWKVSHFPQVPKFPRARNRSGARTLKRFSTRLSTWLATTFALSMQLQFQNTCGMGLREITPRSESLNLASGSKHNFGFDVYWLNCNPTYSHSNIACESLILHKTRSDPECTSLFSPYLQTPWLVSIIFHRIFHLIFHRHYFSPCAWSLMPGLKKLHKIIKTFKNMKNI